MTDTTANTHIHYKKTKDEYEKHSSANSSDDTILLETKIIKWVFLVMVFLQKSGLKAKSLLG